MCNINIDDNFEAFFALTRDSDVSHVLSAHVPRDKRYNEEFFFGLFIDTWCSRASSWGYAQYLVYCLQDGQPDHIDNRLRFNYWFGVSATSSKGIVNITLTFNNLMIKVKMYNIDEDIPLLLSLANMDQADIFYINLYDKLIQPESGEVFSVTRFYPHPFLLWNPFMSCVFTETELRRLHRRFGHANSEKLYNLLKQCELPDITCKTLEILEKITPRCKPCQKHALSPRRFKFTLRDNRDFSHIVLVDNFYIERKPVLHVVDKSTR